MRKYLLTAAAAACLTALAATGLLWRQSARSVLRGALEMFGRSPPSLELKSRPDAERFAFDRSLLEFDRAPPVDQAVSDPESPEYSVRRGFEVKVHSSGYTYPVNLAFALEPAGDPDAPHYYVAELHGSVRYVTRDGRAFPFAEGLLAFPAAPMQISDEFGVSGLAVVPGTRDLLVTHPVPAPEAGRFWNAVTRLFSADGRSCVRRETLKVLSGEPTSPSNQIQQAVFGPDGKLYVSIGDAMNYSFSRHKERWGGKVLRLNLDGTAPEDNPFHDAARPASPANYVFAMGLRNSFDFVFEPAGGTLWAGDVGETLNRLVVVGRGSDHGWDGTPDSFCRNAAYLFQDGFVPVGMTAVDGRVMGSEFEGALWIGGYSYYFGPGPGATKRIVSFQASGNLLLSGPIGVLAYRGEGQSTILGVKQGPDGVYFTDFFGPQSTGDAAGKGRVLRLSPSERTRSLPLDTRPEKWEKWDAARKGKYVFVRIAGCGACHAVERLTDGREGPALTELVPRLSARLGSDAYRRDVEALQAGAEPAAQARLAGVLEARGDDRLRHWLKSHIRDPRFDNPRGKMPAFGLLSAEELDSLVEFLLTLR